MGIAETIGAVSGAKDAAKAAVFILLGVIIAFPLGCFYGNNKKTIFKEGAKIYHTDTITNVKSEIKENTHYYEAHTPNGATFSIISDSPFTFRKIILGIPSQRDTVFRDTCKEIPSLSLIDFRTAVTAELAPVFDKNFSIGLRSEVVFGRILIGAALKLLYFFDSSLPKQFFGYFNIQAGYVL